MNYWKTLGVWHQRFWQAIEQFHPEYLSIDEVDKWNKYFSLCKTMFSPNNGRSYGNGHYLFEKS
jgi:cyclopropane fatty-acyl-phospholipid synthase-like methyltransferase